LATAQARNRLGVLLKEWRRIRRKSQLTIALEAQISPRHLSFVESGRSVPSREMVGTLADALDVPLRERNALMVAAGYAPVYREAALQSEEMSQVRSALERLLQHQEPYPAVVLDRQWNIVQTNRAAPRLFNRFIHLDQLQEPRNLLRAMFDPALLRPWVANWETVAATLIERVSREAVAGIPDPRVIALLEELRAVEGAPTPRRTAAGELPFLPVEFRKDELRLSFFSMITTVGAPADITAQELRVESFFPSNQVTERFARECLAADTPSETGTHPAF